MTLPSVTRHTHYEAHRIVSADIGESARKVRRQAKMSLQVCKVEYGAVAMTMTNSQRRRILEAINDCDQFIKIESTRNPSLRPAEVQRTLDFYIAHKAKLEAMIA